MSRLQEIDTQCNGSLGLNLPNPLLVDENLRGYTVLLSAHFQGFCRALYAESSLLIASEIKLSLQTVVQAQFFAGRALDYGNPNLVNIKKDFERLGLTLNLAGNPANQRRLNDLASLNDWRNIVAHQGVIPPGGFPGLSTIQAWRTSCDGLAVEIDGILYNHLRTVLGRQPWTP